MGAVSGSHDQSLIALMALQRMQQSHPDPGLPRVVAGKGRSTMVGALLLGFICGVIARVLMPGDVFRTMSGPTSWAVSLGLGLAGALVGYVIFTLGLGVGDTDIFDWAAWSAPSSAP